MERRRQFALLIYRLPSAQATARVAIWRELKRLGVLYLQQSVCIVPSGGGMGGHLVRITARIGALGGDYHLVPIRSLPAREEARIIEGFIAQSDTQYAEIIKSCEVNVSKKIAFEVFRRNLTLAQAEKLGQDLDRVRRRYDRVVRRDWFGAQRRQEALDWIGRCEALVRDFAEQVRAAQQAGAVAHPEHDPRPVPLRRPVGRAKRSGSR